MGAGVGRRLLLIVGALSLVASVLVVTESGAAWRRVTRDAFSGDPFVNDRLVCPEGIRFVLGTVQTGVEGDPLESIDREAFRVTTGAVEIVDDATSTSGMRPDGDDLLLWERDPQEQLPPVPFGDPLLEGNDFADVPTIYYYAAEFTVRWNEPVAAGAQVFLWLLGSEPPGAGWNLADSNFLADPPFAGPVTVSDSDECGELFGGEEPPPPPPPPPAGVLRLNANVLSGRNEIRPDLLDFTVFEVSGVELDPGSVRFGAPGRERPVGVLPLGDRAIGTSDLRSRGLDCSATTASVIATTTSGAVVSATDVIRPICK